MRWWWDDGESGRQHRRKPGCAQRIKRWWYIGKCVNRWWRIRKRERECRSTGRRCCCTR
jgi:hypothetical protein